DSAVRKPVRITSNLDRWTGTATQATLTTSIAVCVPPRGYTEIRVTTPASSTIPPDLAALGSAGAPRRGGVFFGEAALAGEIGGTCRAAPGKPRRDRDLSGAAAGLRWICGSSEPASEARARGSAGATAAPAPSMANVGCQARRSPVYHDRRDVPLADDGQ